VNEFEKLLYEKWTKSHSGMEIWSIEKKSGIRTQNLVETHVSCTPKEALRRISNPPEHLCSSEN